MAPKPKSSKPTSAASNTSSGGSVPKKDKYDKIPADIAKEMVKSRNEAARGYNKMGKVVLADAALGAGLAKLIPKVASKVGNVVAESAFGAASKGLNKTGAGGRLYGAQTIKGTALASTRIGTEIQQAARMGNLTKRAENIAIATGKDIAGMTAAGLKDLGKVTRLGVAGKLGTNKKKKK